MPVDSRRHDTRPDPDALLAATAERSQGQLKVFLGAAPGVGKTFEMLTQARRRRAEGVDVLAGVIETHGRADTIAQLDGLPALPLRDVPYRGQDLREFDLDAALARHPGLLLVDELAHTNAPGSRHAKRWEDVAELLTAGIPVWATLNVQHLESLNDDVARITGVRPAETLPDRVLEMADEVEMVDLSPADLLERLRAGKVYRADTARRAAEGFFKEGNLAALREIALRRVAAHVDGDLQDWRRRSGVTGPSPASDRVLALIGPDASAEAVVRQARRLAQALRAPWVALHVERPGSGAGTAGDARGPLALAAALGAQIDQRPAEGDLIETLMAAANAVNATHLVIGRARTGFWRRLSGRTLGAELMRRAPDFALHVVPAPGPVVRRPRSSRGRSAGSRAWMAAPAVVAAVTCLGILLRKVLPGEAMGMVYLAAVTAVAALGGLGPAIAAAALGFLAWDFFFIPPLYGVTIQSPRDVVALLVFAAVALLSGGLAGRVQAEARAAAARIEGLRRVGAFSRRLGEPATEPDLLVEIARQAAALAGQSVVLAGSASDAAVLAREPATTELDEGGWAAARWALAHGEPTGRGTGTLPGARWRFLPLQTVRGLVGVLGVHPESTLDDPLLQAMEALADQAAIALERVRLAAEAARAEALESTQRLRTALLASLGHDLRTPLAGIQGAAGTLRMAWENLTPATRADLLASIEDDVSRMARFLGNISELTRLESGEIKPRLVPVAVADTVHAALARLPLALLVSVQIEGRMEALADPALLEQVVFNVLDNAIKYGPANGLVRVRAAREGAMIAIEVEDEGIGIPPDDLPHVFDSFFRVRRGDRAAADSGTGLGLAIARGLVEAMDGRIEARSPRPNRAPDAAPGAVVTIRVPVAAA